MLLSFLAGSCIKEIGPDQSPDEVTSLKNARPQIKIAFIGGLSYLDPSLMSDCLFEGSDFMKVLSTENVVEELCNPILEQALLQILAEKPDLLLITGELSYKREKISHEAVAKILKDISEQGIKVYVIPGNADINNPAAKAYNGSGSSPTLTITEEEFKNIYKEFGFNNAISRDPNSLSYLSEAYNNLWILGIDARVYPVTSSGLIKPATMAWIKYWLAEANKKNITVLALCHHEITEPWAETTIYGPAYVIKNHETVESELTNAGLRVIFGGYANDITMVTKEENVLYDVCANYLPSPPHAYRLIKMEPNSMKIETRYVTTINASVPGGGDFLVYSNTSYHKRMKMLLTLMYNRSPYNRPRGDDSTPGTADYFGLHFAKALHAFYTGDEEFPPEEEAESQNWPEPFKHVLKSVYTDLPPADLQFTINMKEKLK